MPYNKTQSEVESLLDAVDTKQSDWDGAHSHAQEPHAPSDAQANPTASEIEAAYEGRPDTNKFTDAAASKVSNAPDDTNAALSAKADQGQLASHASDQSNPHAVTKAQVGLGNVDNTSDAAKPVSAAQQLALDGKEPAFSKNGAFNFTIEQLQDEIAAMFQGGAHSNLAVVYDDAEGTISLSASGGGGGGSPLTQEEVEDFVAGVTTQGEGINIAYDDGGNTLTISLSGESFTTAEKNKVANLPSNTSSELAGKEPTISKNSAFNKGFGAASGSVCEGNDPRLSDDRDPNPHSHNASDISSGAFADGRIAESSVTQHEGAINALNLANAPAEPGATGDQTGAEIKAAYESEGNTNAFTDAEKSKLAGLESSRFKGVFANLSALLSAHPSGLDGDYADVDAGASSDVQRYVWDGSDSAWVLVAGTATAETAASVKAKYESNPDTNAFTDSEKSKVGNVPANTNAELAGKSALGHGHSASDIGDFGAEVAGNAAVALNTAKVGISADQRTAVDHRKATTHDNGSQSGETTLDAANGERQVLTLTGSAAVELTIQGLSDLRSSLRLRIDISGYDGALSWSGVDSWEHFADGAAPADIASRNHLDLHFEYLGASNVQGRDFGPVAPTALAVETLTQAEYDALGSPVSTTLYIITDA